MATKAGLKDVWTKKIGRHRGSSRIWFDGLQAVRAGFAPGENFEIDVEGQRIIIQKKIDGSRTVCSKTVTRQGVEQVMPVIDINSAELLKIFDGMDAIRVVVADDRVYLLPLASESRKVERLNRLADKLRSGEPLLAGSLAHGGGILAHAIHQGLKDSGIQCKLAFANEIREDLILQALQHNDVWGPESTVINAPMQELAQDEWLLSHLPKLELLEMGLPCSGASKAGHTKNKLTKMEDHQEIGHLVYSALVVVSKTNPSIICFENVPQYKDTASAQILRLQLRDMGYHTHEAIMDGADFGCLEKRRRWCMVACTRGVEFDFDNIRPAMTVVRQLGDVLDPTIELDDPRWREVAHLKDKMVRNAVEGNNFKMQFIHPESTTVPVLRKGYNKAGSSDPRLQHPTRPELSRLLTAKEHAAVKGLPASLAAIADDFGETNAHQLFGQGIVYEPLRAVGERIGDTLMEHARRLEDQRQNPNAEAATQDSNTSLPFRRQRVAG